MIKNEYINRNETYNWKKVISTGILGTTISLIPLLPLGYALDRNNYKNKKNSKDSKLISSYIPAILGSLIVGIGLNNVDVS